MICDRAREYSIAFLRVVKGSRIELLKTPYRAHLMPTPSVSDSSPPDLLPTAGADKVFGKDRRILVIIQMRDDIQGFRDREAFYSAQAPELARRLLASAESNGRMGRVIEILAMRALVYQARGELTRALEDLCRSLTLGGPEGYFRLFVDEGEPMARLLRTAQARGIRPAYVAKLLAALPPKERAAPIPQSDLVEPLTDRELEVLRLISEGISYREIADRLVVSVNTVRFHVKGIYGKLGGKNRAAAIAQARTLKLLS